MITIRPAHARGYFDFGWLQTSHSFSFGQYHDPAHMGFSDLRVINHDVVQGGQGFGTHPHRDMEIVTYVLSGALAHKDSTGNAAIIKPGEVQRMSAGTGITHSEFNASQDDPVELLQIWVLPDRAGHQPGYEQKPLPASVQNGFGLIASPDGEGGSVRLHQDARIYAARLDAGQTLSYDLRKGRRVWVQVAQGNLILNEHDLVKGDGVRLQNEARLDVKAGNEGAEILLFDLR